MTGSRRAAEPPEVIGRERERDRLGAFIDAVPCGVHSLVVSGEAGIGKTVLWSDAILRCRRAGYRVLRARGSEEDMSGVLVGLRDLFEHTSVAASALTDGADPFERGAAVLATLRELAAAGPVILAIDDLQWLDAVSARSLRHALRRLVDEPVGVLATLRTESGTEDPLALMRCLPPGRHEAISLGPLQRDDVRRLLGRIVPTVSPITLRRIHHTSAGNPLYAIELMRSLANEDGAAEIPEGLPLPTSLQSAIERRLTTVPTAVLPVLDVVAVSGPALCSLLEQALPDSDVEELVMQASALDLLVVEDDLRVRFSHPLMATAVYRRMNPIARRTLHARLAAVADDPDSRVRHLALSTDAPDASIAADLEAAALKARGRGASDVAAGFARHSHRLTPTGDVADRRRRALMEIANLAAAGEARRARDLVDGLVAALPPGPDRAAALVHRFYVENDDVASADATLQQALEDAAADALLRGRVLDILGWFRGVFGGDLAAGISACSEAVAIAETERDKALWMLAAGHLAHMQALAGSPDVETMERAVALSDELGGPTLGGGPRAWLAKQRLWAGELAAARSMFGDVLSAHVATGNELERAYRFYDLALLEIAAGNPTAALEYATRGVEAAQDSANADAEGWVLYPLALAHVWLGEPAAARSAARRLLEWPGRPGERLGTARAYSALGLLALAEGDATAASGELRVALSLLERVGVAHPGAVPVLPDAIIACASSGATSEAADLLHRLEAQADTLGDVRTRAMLHHARGVVHLADGDADEATVELEAAVRAFDKLGFAPDAARATLACGRALMRSGHRTQAAERLADARKRFATIGAPLWEAQAVTEIERVSPGRSRGVLTRAEARVARLVVQGAKNREVAAALFMSVATVEAHLTRIYRKVGVRSRTELARLVTQGELSLETGEAA